MKQMNFHTNGSGTMDGDSEDPIRVFARLVTDYVWDDDDWSEIGRKLGAPISRRAFALVVRLMQYQLIEEGIVDEN